MLEPEEDQEQVCAFPGCKATVDQHDWCWGCQSYVCQTHSERDPWGIHHAEAHWDELADPENQEGNFC